jgi:WD40 repeat protein
VLIAGGYAVVGNGAPTIATAEIYDPGTGTFSSTGPLVTGRSGHSATLLTSGKVLIAGGGNNNNGFLNVTLASAELYDPLAGTFSATGSMNMARSAPATLLSDGKVLVAGGVLPNIGALSSAEVYDPSTGMFAFTGSLLTERYNNNATLLQNGKVLIAGGNDNAGNLLASAELYDPAAGAFLATGSLNLPRSSPATLLNNGQVLFVGGNDVSSSATQQSLNMSELYDSASGVFIVNARTNAFRFFLTVTLLNSGQVLVTGQETSAIIVTPPVPSELYQP